MASKKSARPQAPAGGREPLWYKDAIIYQVHVKSFADSNGDGIGDFDGLTAKLDYLQGLGVTALWLLPFYPSPLKDDGYDIAAYDDVNPAYGDLAAFRRFLREAHRRDLKVITELVVNHTSDQHPWFQRARRAKPGTKARNFYVWSDDPERYREARIIFKDFETSNWTWDPVAEAYFWHRFYHHQPDLNFEEPAVFDAITKAMDLWFKMGVDGMRLDAVPYLFEREGTNCENLPETHELLKRLRAHLDQRFDNRMLLAEANQWPDDSIAYFGDGDECHMAFHFPVMPRLFMAVRMEDRFPVIDILDQTPAIPESCQWATFLRNHDELTLEMVTDEDRDYMYRSYAADPRARINLGIRRRLAPLLGNDRRRIELMNALLFSLPGAPIIYYGDEIGMGDNIYLGDRHGVRTPMQWSSDKNAGFSRANPQKLYLPVIVDPEYHYEAINVEAQDQNSHSLLWWTRRLVALRKRYQAFSRGSIEFLYPTNHKVLAFVRRHGDERVLVVANLSRYVQHVELDMKGADPSYVGTTPVELFGRTPFPPIGDWPYLLTLGPHGFYWFALERERLELGFQPTPRGETPARLPSVVSAAPWRHLFDRERGALEPALPEILASRRWFGGKARSVRAVAVREAFTLPLAGGGNASRGGSGGDADPVAAGRGDAVLALVEVDYLEGEPETYTLAVAFAEGDAAVRVARDWPLAVLARLDGPDGGGRRGILYDALWEPEVARALLGVVGRRRRLRSETGEITGRTVSGGSGGLTLSPPLEPRLGSAEQSNTSVVFGDRYILKLFRKVDPGVNPDLEIGRFLAGGEAGGFAHTPAVVGWLEHRTTRGGGSGGGSRQAAKTLAVLHRYVANEGDAWSYTLDALGRYYERVLSRGSEAAAELADARLPSEPLLELAGRQPPQAVRDLLGTYLPAAELLGRRTAEMHLALAGEGGGDTDLDTDTGTPGGSGDGQRELPEDFRPEEISTLYQRSLYQAMRTLAGRTLRLLSQRLDRLPAATVEDARALIARRPELLARFQALSDHKLDAVRIRVHGDYHLGQVLYTGRDFQVIDFEGEPARPISERRLKRSPIKDVAGMLRSFDYAAEAELRRRAEGRLVSPEEAVDLGGAARLWQRWASAVFLGAYLERAAGARFLPAASGDLAVLLDAYLLEKALYELAYELNNRPDWVSIPLAGITRLLDRGRPERP